MTRFIEMNCKCSDCKSTSGWISLEDLAAKLKHLEARVTQLENKDRRLA